MHLFLSNFKVMEATINKCKHLNEVNFNINKIKKVDQGIEINLWR